MRSFSRYLLLGLIILVIISSLCPNSLIKKNEILNKIFYSFSLKTNIKAIFHSDPTKQDHLSAIHGIRSLNALALLLFHKAVVLLFAPYINKATLIEVKNN